MAGGELLGQYRAALIRRNYSIETIRKRCGIVRRWLEHHDRDWATVTWREVDAYGDWRRVSPSAWRDEVSHLSHFYKWAMRNEYTNHDPTALVERPRVGKRLPRPAGDHDYARIVDDAPAQVRAIIELMAWSGLRCCEIAALQRHDVDLIKRIAIVRGKGDRERIVGLPRRVVRALAAIDAGGMYVFQNRAGNRYQSSRISQIVSLHCQAREVKITAHQLRHRFATIALELVEGQLDVVQIALGHASVATTEIYAQTSETRVRELLRRLDAFDRDQPDRLFELEP